MNAYADAGPAWNIVLAGRRVELPATIDTIRAGLSGERLAEFDEEVDRTPAKHLLHTLIDFALPERVAETDPEAVARLRAGDFTGVADLDGNPVHPAGPLPGAGDREAATTWSVEHTGRPPVRFPATIGGIRAGLSGERLAEFRQETGRTPGHELATLLFRWSYPPEERAADDEVFTRLASGDFTGCVPQTPAAGTS